MSNKTSPLYQRTDKAIRRAFIELLKRKNFDKITVQDILDETPVTRGTFYSHFRDKYEIAEQMQAEYFRKTEEVKARLASVSKDKYPSVINESMSSEIDDILLLSNIHTDTVDIRRMLEQSYIDMYCREHPGPTAAVEAEIYAKSMAVFLFAYPKLQATGNTDTTFIDQIMIEVFTNILRINSAETKEFLVKQIEKATKK